MTDTDTIVVQRAGGGDAVRVRALRLQALTDAPDAFWTTAAEERKHPMRVWRERLGEPAAATFLAVRGGNDIGIAVGHAHHDTDGDAGLYSMWVAPKARRSGAGRVLIEAVLDWARTDGYPLVRIEVADANEAAIAAYTRLGFTPTGRTGAMPSPRDHITEHELARRP